MSNLVEAYPGFETNSLDILLDEAGSLFAERCSNVVVHSRHPAEFRDAIACHAELAADHELAGAQEEATKFKKLFKVVYGIDI